MNGLHMDDWNVLFNRFREAGGLTYCGWIMDYLRQGLKLADNGEEGSPTLRLEKLHYTANGIRGEIYCRFDKRTYVLEIKPTDFAKNEGAETLQKTAGELNNGTESRQTGSRQTVETEVPHQW